MSTSTVVAGLLALALIVGAICGAIAYTQYQETQRRQTCVTSGGSWVKENQCLRFVQVTGQ